MANQELFYVGVGLMTTSMVYGAVAMIRRRWKGVNDLAWIGIVGALVAAIMMGVSYTKLPDMAEARPIIRQTMIVIGIFLWTSFAWYTRSSANARADKIEKMIAANEYNRDSLLNGLSEEIGKQQTALTDAHRKSLAELKKIAEDAMALGLSLKGGPSWIVSPSGKSIPIDPRYSSLASLNVAIEELEEKVSKMVSKKI